MLGWEIGVHRFADAELRGHRGDLDSIRSLIAARTESSEIPIATEGDRPIAVWRAGLGGIYWLDQLVGAGVGAHTMRGGYPESYLIRGGDFCSRVRAGLPEEHARRTTGPLEAAAREPRARGMDVVEIEDFDPEEWLLVEAWYEAGQDQRAASGGAV